MNNAVDLEDEAYEKIPDFPIGTTINSILCFGVAQSCLITCNSCHSETPHLLFISRTTSPCFPTIGKCRCILLNLPLSLVARILVDSMDPDSIFALDAVLNSTECYPLRSIAALPSDQCVLVKNDHFVPCSSKELFKDDFLFIPSELDSYSYPPLYSRRLPASSRRKSFNSVHVALTCSLNFIRSFALSPPLTLQVVYSESRYGISQDAFFFIDPLFASCKAWRWVDLRPGEWLRRLHICRSSRHTPPNRLCINPQHWSRVICSDDSDSNCDADYKFATRRHVNEPDLVRVCGWAGGGHMNPFPCCLVRTPKNVPTNRDVSVSGSISDLLGYNHTIPPSVNGRGSEAPSSEMKSDMLSAVYAISSGPFYRNSLPGWSAFTDASQKSLRTDHTCNTDITTVSLESQTEDLKLTDFYTGSASNESSISSFPFEDLNPRNRPKKPRHAFDRSEPTVLGIRAVLPLKHTWANLSYWESNHHVAKGWFKLDDPVVYVLYSEVMSKDSPKSRSGRSSDHSTCVRRCHDTSYIRLSPLVTQPRHRIRTIYSAKLSMHNNTNFIHTARKKRLSFFPADNPEKPSTSWRQCYRLGGSGLVLSLAPQGRVWLDNQVTANNLPVFVSSPCLSCSPSSTNSLCWPVRRVPSGFSIVVFDLLVYLHHLAACFATDSPSSAKVSIDDPQASLISSFFPNPVVHISLGKGWGPCYRRPDITQCPARLELWINMHSLLGLIDK